MKEKTMKVKIITRRFKHFKAGDEQTYVEVYPPKRKHDRSDIDIFRLVIKAKDEKTGKEELKELDMTPDEALMIANDLTNATMFWLINYKSYWDTFMKRKRELDKKMRAKSKTKSPKPKCQKR